MDRKNEEHLDPRQRKTRALLVKALAELMEERPFSELSVVDICSRAMVHRTTFYAHFNDKRELLSYLLSQLERECVETCLPKEEMTSPKEYFLTAVKNALGFFQDRRSLYLACLNSGMEAEVHVLSDRAAQELCRRLSQPAFRDAAPEVDPQIAARFYIGAVLALIRWWLTNDDPVPQETLLSNLSHFILID
ncbi:MAG: TetR/AcrR family transcriptional regulator [Lawsonibacter sp.]|jgi:AcrR family transcriptional regulator|nr:TetR family transcriptional regulator [Oscillospiraceae bacterium]